MQWAKEFLDTLNSLDHRKILTIFLLCPNEMEGAAEGRFHDSRITGPRIFPIFGPLDMAMFIEGEWGAEAGNMLVTGMLLPNPRKLLTMNSMRKCQIRVERKTSDQSQSTPYSF